MRTVNVFTVVVMKFAELIALVALAVVMTLLGWDVMALKGEFHSTPRTVCAADAIGTF